MKLKQLVSISAGYPFRGRIDEKADSAVLAVQMKDVSPRHGIHWPSCTRTELNGRREPDWLRPGDILVIARGSHNYAVMVGNGVDHADFQAVAAPNFFVLSTKRQEVIPEYLTWFLNQSPCQRYFGQNAEGTLTKSIRRTILEDLPIVVPALSQQHAIVAMANTLRQEQQLAEHLVRSGENMMNTIAENLMTNSSHQKLI